MMDLGMWQLITGMAATLGGAWLLGGLGGFLLASGCISLALYVKRIPPP